MNNSEINLPKPQTIWEIINNTFQLYQQHFVDFVSLVAVLVIPFTLLTTSISSSFPDEVVLINETTREITLPDGFGIFIILQIIGALLQGIIASGLITYIISERIFGQKLSIFEAASTASEKLMKLAGGLLTFGMVFLVGLLILAVLGGVLIIPLFAIPVLMYLGVAVYFFVVPVFMLEKVDIPTGLGRALVLGKSRFWQTLGLILLLALLSGLIATLIELFLSLFFGDALLNPSHPISLTLSVIINILVAPLQPIALTLMYFDIRIRTENLDQSLVIVDGEIQRTYEQEPPQPPQRILDRSDLTNIVLFFGLLIVLTSIIASLGTSLLLFG